MGRRRPRGVAACRRSRRRRGPWCTARRWIAADHDGSRADRHHAGSRRADRRLRPPLRDVQAGDAPAASSRSSDRDSSPTTRGRSSSCSPARRIPTTSRARHCSPRSSPSHRPSTHGTASSSWPTTTSRSPGRCTPDATCGSTTRSGRTRRRGRAVRSRRSTAGSTARSATGGGTRWPTAATVGRSRPARPSSRPCATAPSRPPRSIS